MRRRALLLLASLVASLAATTLPAAPAEAAAPPACPWTNSTLRTCNVRLTAGARGSVGILGDSVLQGSADGFWGTSPSSPQGLPSMLAANGFGPINLIATQGMKTKWTADNNVSAFYWVDRWANYGFNPAVIALNLGANHFTTCTAANPAPCKAQIDILLNEIALKHPNAIVWWSKTVQYSFTGTPPVAYYTSGMLGWNAALDQASAERANLVLWDWPTALATANPPIAMDPFGIHAAGPSGYVRRSTMMAEDITTRMSSARYAGPRVALPAASDTAMAFAPVAATGLYSTPADGATLAAGETRDIDLSGAAAVDPDAGALALTVTASNAAANGYLLVYRCGDTPPATSNVNYAAGITRTAQAIARITDAGHICVFSSASVNINISLQGNLRQGVGSYLNPITPVRPLDTRITGRAQDHVVAVPGTGVAAAAITLTTNGTSAGGTLTVYDCDDPMPSIANVSFQANETVASAAFVGVSAAGTVCVHVSTGDSVYTEVILDVTGTFGATGLGFVPVPATRLLDTRYAIGGWIGRHGGGQSVDVLAAPAGALAVTGTITMVRPVWNGHLKAYPCGGTLPPNSSVNSRAGTVMANSVTVGVEPTQRTVCIYSSHNTNSLFDVVGWWVEVPG
ncbi:MAG: SGNH/GDSL hydrolase family protein [Actinomycetota bacterium]|nr:SGNH/GDSL hydrolase family protein [Actinomycetota bacterium]